MLFADSIYSFLENKLNIRSMISDWGSHLLSIQLSKKDLNTLIINYLCLEGFEEAATAFSKDTGIHIRTHSSRTWRIHLTAGKKQNTKAHHFWGNRRGYQWNQWLESRNIRGQEGSIFQTPNSQTCTPHQTTKNTGSARICTEQRSTTRSKECNLITRLAIWKS